jgi:uroporphyrinogen-III synthase
MAEPVKRSTDRLAARAGSGHGPAGHPDSPPLETDLPLASRTVVVTRPAGQADAQIDRLRTLGARVVHVPLVAIEPPSDPERARATLERLDELHLAIFVSANAVSGALALLRPGVGLPAGLRVAAVGKATAAALRAHAITVDHVPEGRFDSESLLALDALQAASVSGRRVLIVRGEGGRETLAEGLRVRGALVEYAEVYQRVKPVVDVAALEAEGRAGRIDALLITSGEALAYLLELVPPSPGSWMARAVLVVPSERVREYARRLGYPGAAVVARDASDRGLVDALREHWARASLGEAPGP